MDMAASNDSALLYSIPREDDIQKELLEMYRSQLPARSPSHDRAWSWPLDLGQEKALERLHQRQPQATRPGIWAPLGSIVNRNLMTAVCTGILIVYVAMNTWRYINTPGPTILQGWSDQCPATWLHGGSPDMVLLEYERRYPDLGPPWRVVHAASASYKKCWHGGDRYLLHRNNNLNISFPSPGTAARATDFNRLIMDRGDEAVKHLSTCGFPCKRLIEPPADDLPLLGSKCRHQHQCRIRDALGIFLIAALNPYYNRTANYPLEAQDLPQYCPCSFSLAWKSLRQTHAYLPSPRSIHPFYTDRESSLYQAQDLYSWWVWLWGNGFFIPGRRTSIEQVSDAELMQLYADGFWDNGMGGKRKFDTDQVRQARGLKVPKKRKEEIAQICRNFGSWCEEAYMAYVKL